MTPKERMLAAYRGKKQDVTPVAPEFWNYYPAKLLGLPFDRFEREIPHWFGLKTAFEKFGCEGWGIALPEVANPRLRVKSEYIPYADHSREKRTETIDGRDFVRVIRYMPTELSFIESRPVTNAEDVRAYFEAKFSDEAEFDFHEAVSAYEEVGESFLLELFLGDSFFDAFEQIMGFENALFYFLEEDREILVALRERYVRYMKRLVDGVAATPFESCFIGCSSACNSLLGPKLWREWDKPFYKEITDHIHEKGLLLHVHNHGRVMETVPDFRELGFDCVCPFEREPGDVNGLDGLRAVREKLGDEVTFNGNVSTVKTLVRGTPEDVRREVREIKSAFKGSNRVIIGTGDQVCYETPEENLWAMIEEGRANP